MAFVQQMESASNAMPIGMNNPNDRDMSLAVILDFAIQRTYHQLMIMTDIFPTMPDKESYICMQNPAVVHENLCVSQVPAYCSYKCFGKDTHAPLIFDKFLIIANGLLFNLIEQNILQFLDQQAFMFVDTADYLYNLARVKLVNARLPNYSIPTAVDVLTLGTYPKLPTCIKERVLPPEQIEDKDKYSTLKTLNRIIKCRLALSELPEQLYNFQIQNGFVKFLVKNEFEIVLTVASDDYAFPWRLLFVKILIKNPQDPNRTLVHPLQVQYIHDVLQKRLYESDKPLIDLFKSLHFFCQSLKLEILFQQMDFLNAMTYGKYYRICEYANLKQITVKYWLDYSRSEYDFRFTIMTGENSDYLQTSHYPPLNWSDQKNIDNLLKSDNLVIQKIIQQVIKIRSKRRLIDIRPKFDGLKYCKTYLDEEKPAIKIQFLNSDFDNEYLWVSIDFYSGLFSIYMSNTPQNFSILNSIENCLNSDMGRLDACMHKLRIWLILKRCEITLRRLPFRFTHEIPIVSYSNNDVSVQFNKIIKNRLFVELSNKEKIFMMLTCKTKDDISKDEVNLDENQEFFDNNDNYIQINYYLLKLLKCKYEGDDDYSMQYLKLMSIAQLKRDSVISFSNPDVNRNISEPKPEQFYGINKNGLMSDVLKMITNIEERLGLFNSVSVLNKQNVITQSVQTDRILNKPELKILNITQAISSAQQQHVQLKGFLKLSNELCSKLLLCTIRRVNVTKHALISSSSTKQMAKKFNYTIEFKFNENLIVENSRSLSTKYRPFDMHIAYLNVKNVDNLYEQIKDEWLHMCHMYKLVRQLNKAFVAGNTIPPGTLSTEISAFKITFFDFKTLIVNYGCNLSYKIAFKSTKDLKGYDLFLLTKSMNTSLSTEQTPLINYHYLCLYEIKKYMNMNENILGLIQILNETCMPTYSLAKLSNLPKLYVYPLVQATPQAGFMLVAQSLTHFRLFYYARYAIEIHLLNNGLVSIKDASFGLTDLNTSFGDLHPIALLSSFVHLFWDDNVEELLKRRSSIVDDDNPVSPVQINYNTVPSHIPLQQQSQQQWQTSSSAQQQQAHHVFLPPTSPAVRAQLPIPSPIHNYSVHSPGNVAQNIQTLAPLQSNYLQTGPPSIAAPSPGSFQNYGSPAVLSHSSPMNHTAAVQSPGGFLSPAPNYQIQSPANTYEIQMQSPVPAMPIKSPFTCGFVGPSTNQGSNQQTISQTVSTKDSLEDVPKNRNNHFDTQYKKCYSASVPTYLSHNGFAKMLLPSIDNGYTPLETFLASNHLKKAFLKYIQADPSSYHTLTSEQNSQIFATKFLRLQLINDIKSNNYAAFALHIDQHVDQQLQLQTDRLQEYFNTRILCPPYRATSLYAFLNMLSMQDQRTFREFLQLLEWEMVFSYGCRIKLCWTVPFTHHFKNPSQMGSYFQTCGPAFNRKDKYYFMFYLILPASPRAPQSNLLYACAYDPSTNSIQCEQLKTSFDTTMSPFENRILGIFNQGQEICKSRNDPNMLPFVFNHLLNSLNQPPATPMMQQQNMM